MIVNLSILFLAFRSNLNSPIISSSPSFYPVSYYFQHLNINHAFNPFFLKNSLNIEKLQFNSLIFKYSLFSDFLNSVMVIKDNYNEKNKEFNTQLYIPSTEAAGIVDVGNCCFINCQSRADSEEGGAISIGITYTNLKIVKTLFSRCSSTTIGGAIFTVGSGFVITSSEFSDCTSSDSGGSIFSNKYKRPGGGFQTLLNQSIVINTICNYLPLDLNASSMISLNCNFTNNKNNYQSDPSDPKQYCFGFPLITTGDDYKFYYANYVSNDGDCVMELNSKSQSKIGYVNVINNKNLNFFFFDDPEGPQSEYLFEGNFLRLTNFAFFGNTVSPKSTTILFGNNFVDIVPYKLENCWFQYSQATVNSMLNGHLITGGQFDMQTATYTQEHLFTRPNFCVYSTDVFSQSSTFSESSTFSKSSIFSNSLTFSESSTFSEVSDFSVHSIYNDASLHFSDSSFFSHSNTILVHSQTSPFTPSLSFTASNFFTPKRTKVPDPQNIFNRADVSGKVSIFTKEELKKAAAPASISLALIIVAIVFTVLYLRRKIYELRNHENVPEFDTSFDEETENDSDYSYSYYTYEYYYESQYSDTEHIGSKYNKSYSSSSYDYFTYE